MGIDLFINVAITGVCLLILGIYYNFREKRFQGLADDKFQEVKEKYIMEIAAKKARERAEIEKLKEIVSKVEEKHRRVIAEKNVAKAPVYDLKEVDNIIKNAEEKAAKLIEEAREESRQFLEDQRKEVQEKMIDLVIGVTRKVLQKSLSYKDHKELIEAAFKEMEGETKK